MKRTRVPSRALPAICLLCLLLTACGSSAKTGTVTAPLAQSRGGTEFFAVIHLDDGSDVLALPYAVTKLEDGWKQELTRKGQRVEVEPFKKGSVKDTQAEWKIVRVLESGK